MASVELTAERVWTKGCSPTCSNQTDKNNCVYHTLTKIIIKNVFEKVLDLRLTPQENDRYDLCMPLTIPPRVSGYRDGKYPLNAEKRIKLFYYLFSLFEYTNSKRVSEALSLLDMPTNMSEIPKGRTKGYFRAVQYIDDKVLHAMKREFLAKSTGLTWKHIHLQMDMDDFEPIKQNVLAPILALNLYFELGLSDVEEETDKHIVLITGLDDETIHIKNTWGTLLDKVRWDETILLDHHTFQVTDLHTILPMPKGSEVKSEYDVRNVDELFAFVADYTFPKGGRRTRKRRTRKLYSLKKWLR